MVDFVTAPVNSGTSKGFSFTSQVRVANPIASNITWTEVVASTSEEWGGLSISVVNNDRGILFIGIGAAGSEVIIANPPVCTGLRQPIDIFIPIKIASGTRVAVGCSCFTSATIEGQIVGYPSSKFSAVPSFTVMEFGPYDLTASSSVYGRHKQIDPGGTANTKGAYTEISLTGGNNDNNVLNGNSLANAYDYFGVMTASNFNSAQSVQDRLWDVATGAAASEDIFIPDLYQGTDASEYSSKPNILFDPEGAVSGARISARMQSSITDATDRIGTALLVGLR